MGVGGLEPRSKVTDPPRLARRAAWVLLVLGILALTLAVWVRHLASQVEVTAVSLRPSFGPPTPGVIAVVVGYNPLPVAVELRSLRLTVGETVLPSAVELGSAQHVEVPAGPFRIETSFAASGSAVGAVAGQGLAVLLGRPLDYRIALVVGRGRLERALEFSGDLSPARSGG